MQRVSIEDGFVNNNIPGLAVSFPVIELVLSGRTFRTKIDTADLAKVLAVSTRWHAKWDGTSKTFYVAGTRQHIFLHRVLTDAPEGMTVDHFDHDGLNNRRSSNLRVVSQSVNSFNRRTALGISGFRGVTPRGDKWRASIMVQRKRHVIGDFVDPKLASEAVSEFLRTQGVQI